MGRTFRKNDRWKKDRRDQNFKKSKKFKDIQYGQHQNKPVNEIPLIEEDPYDLDNDMVNP
jgi:hypothetical protein